MNDNNTDQIVVSVCCLAYNHEPYIQQCLDGFVMQQTNFKYEVLINDDASTDATADIIREYELKYPNIIKPIYQKNNLYSQGVAISATYLYPRAQGKYIAKCEGDDYWTDPHKLQKQVDFLEANPEYSLCCHRYDIYTEDTKTWDEDYVSNLFANGEEDISFSNKENFDCWITKTLTLLYRKDVFDPEILFKYKYSRDVHLNYHLLKVGKGYCMNYNAGVYRRHSGGVFASLDNNKKLRDNYVIHKEMLSFNLDDITLQQHFGSIGDVFFDRLRNQIKNREFSAELKQDLKMYLKDIYKMEGLKMLIMKFKKILLSYKYGFRK